MSQPECTCPFLKTNTSNVSQVRNTQHQWTAQLMYLSNFSLSGLVCVPGSLNTPNRDIWMSYPFSPCNHVIQPSFFNQHLHFTLATPLVLTDLCLGLPTKKKQQQTLPFPEEQGLRRQDMELQPLTIRAFNK